MSSRIDRRTFLKGSIATSACAGGALAAAAQEGTPSTNTLPHGKIAGASFCRVLLGGNLITFHMHSRDLRYVHTLASHYNTRDKILQTLRVAESHGIDSMSVSAYPHVMDMLKEHRNERGGKMKWIICSNALVTGDFKLYEKQVKSLAKDGADAIYLHGGHSDRMAAAGKFDLIRKAVEIIKATGRPGGVGAHDLNVVRRCEEDGIPADFYVKTFHHHQYPTAPRPEEIKGPHGEIPGYWCSNPDEVAEFMKKVEKPWIAFKIMAAGAIMPQSAFRWAFRNGADHILVGMFDFQIGLDVKIAKDALEAAQERERPWRS